MSKTFFHAENAWLPEGWKQDVRFHVDDGRYLAGALLEVGRDVQTEVAESLGRWVVPGMPNLHSHAFQRAMAGLAETRGDPQDSFWSWREVMYAFAGLLGPDELRAIATQLYVEMLKAGYTQVCEFHYLHHQPDGRPYADPAAMSLALIDAAQEAGIGLTLLGYWLGRFEVIQSLLEPIVIGIVILSVLPMAFEWYKRRKAIKQASGAAEPEPTT